MKKIIEVKNLSIGIQKQERRISLTDNINLIINEKETYGLIGESGCGKTITSLAIAGMLPEPEGVLLSGQVIINNKNIFELSPEELQQIRGSEIGVIFQEPFMALNPLYTIRFHFEELYKFHKKTINEKKIDYWKRLEQLFKRIGFYDPEYILNLYPHQLSGGMLQRIVIVLAIILKPKIIIADEPTTALDVTVQGQIMKILTELKIEENTAVLLITHNMGLLAQYADRISVMYAGRIVETSNIEEFLENPAHPYSKGLIQAIPELDVEKTIKGIEGTVPSPENYETGCRFFNRCSLASIECKTMPYAKKISETHEVFCWKVK